MGYDGIRQGRYAGLYAYPDGERSRCLLWNFLPGLTGEVDPATSFSTSGPRALPRRNAQHTRQQSAKLTLWGCSRPRLPATPGSRETWAATAAQKS